MDGQNVETIQSGNSANIMWPYALTVDYDSQILYWADAFFDTISSSPVEPGSPITLITSAASGYVRLPYSIVTLQETLFFTDWFNGVSSLHTSGTNYSTLTPREAQFLCNQNPYGIELVTSQRQAESELCIQACISVKGYFYSINNASQVKYNHNSIINIILAIQAPILTPQLIILVQSTMVDAVFKSSAY